jgi:hypothetical protein
MIEEEDGYFEDTWWNDTYGSTQYDRLKNAPIITTAVNGKRAGNLQSDKRHEPVVIPLKHTVTDAPLLCRPTELERSPLMKTFENPPLARITLNEETTVKEE